MMNIVLSEQPPMVELDVSESLTVGRSVPEFGGIARRRGAVRHQKIHAIQGHEFLAKFFRQPTYCSFCSEFLW